MSRFTYEPELDRDGNLLGTRIVETGGYFAGRTVRELEAIAERLYPEHDPDFRYNGMQQEFYDIHFNYCVRKRLEQCDIGLESCSVQLSSEPAGVR